MSAYICELPHINALACYAVDNRLWSSNDMSPSCPCTEQEQLGALLYAENAKSVAYRYTEEPEDDYEFHFVQTIANSAVQMIKAVRCYQYQACEHPGWDKSAAHTITEAIIEHAIARIPGYDSADWGWKAPDATLVPLFPKCGHNG